MPQGDTIAKLKYYYGPYNQVKGFRKFMELPKRNEEVEINQPNELWENISSFILHDKAGTIKKLPFRLEGYNEKYGRLDNDLDNLKPPIIKKAKKNDRKMTFQQVDDDDDDETSFTPTIKHTVKDLSKLLTPVKTTSTRCIPTELTIPKSRNQQRCVGSKNHSIGMHIFVNI